jgi:steroid delta-isomerase-like uncharacterized protein
VICPISLPVQKAAEQCLNIRFGCLGARGFRICSFECVFNLASTDSQINNDWATMTIREGRMSARCQIVDEHVRHENEHDLDAIMDTFGDAARYDDEAWSAHYHGRDEVRRFYGDLLRALPDLQIIVRHRHIAEEAIILEAAIRGHHLETWRGLRATGRKVEFPLCAIFTFDEGNRLAGEKIYYDRATILRQLGVLHDPEHAVGRFTMAVAHPITMARILGGMLRGFGSGK